MVALFSWHCWTHRRYLKTYNVTFLQAWGMTETNPIATVARPIQKAKDLAKTDAERFENIVKAVRRNSYYTLLSISVCLARACPAKSLCLFFAWKRETQAAKQRGACFSLSVFMQSGSDGARA